MVARGKLYLSVYIGVATLVVSILGLVYVSSSPNYATGKRFTDIPIIPQSKSLASTTQRNRDDGVVKTKFLPEEEPERRLPNALIVGCAKCGTRALLFFLTFHPDIISVGPEIHFFDKDENYRKGYRWYINNFRPRLQNQIGIEKSPAYFTVDGVPERIHKMNSSIKIIVIVCEPVRKAVSQFAQLHDKPGSTIKSLEVLVLNPTTGDLEPNKGTLAAGIYQKHLQRWLQWFPLEQMLFVDGDRLAVDPLPEIRPVEQYLGVSRYFNKDNIVLNRTKGFYCVDKDGLHCLDAGKGRPHPYVDPVLKQKLADFYRPFNEKFMSAVGRRFSWNLWN